MNQYRNCPHSHRDRPANCQLTHTLNNISFSSYWKNTSIKSLSAKKQALQNHQDQRLMTEQNISGLFDGIARKSKEKAAQMHKKLAKKSIARRDFSHIEFLKPFDEYDKLLTGLPQTTTNKENFPKMIPCDLTEKFKKDYIFGKIIGEGAESEVRLAIFRQTNEVVAIKAYSKSRMIELNRKKAIRREVKILQVLNHPNILRMFDVVQSKNHLSIIMQFLPGISLSQCLKLKSKKCFKQQQCRQVIKKLASALEYLHRKRIAHRDIKLENVIVDKDLTPKLIDFGFSTCIDSNTKTRLFCGTPSYMAPELVQKRYHRGEKADIWALGVLMFVMLVGYFPFVGNTDEQLYSRINSVQFPVTDIRSFKNAFNLICHIFVADADTRITAAEILEHPWFHEQRSECSSRSRSKNFKLRQFHKIISFDKEKSNSKDNKREESPIENRLRGRLIKTNNSNHLQHNLNPLKKASPQSTFRGNKLLNSKFLKETNSLSEAKNFKERTLNSFNFQNFGLGGQNSSKSPCKTYRL